MAVFKQDTIYYRHDHPNGYMFAAGADEPSVSDGWAVSPDRIQPAPEKVYECTTFDAYEALLQSERAAKVALTGQAAEARAAFDQLIAIMQATAERSAATQSETEGAAQ